MLKHIFYLLCVSIIVVSCQKNDDQQALKADSNDYEMVWSDEFDIDGLPDATKWNYDLADGCPNVCGWGNNELQYYTDRSKNARVENGHLVIEAHKETFENKNFTSARLVSREKGDWLYGKFEIRAKLPTGLGTWPAIWMLPTDWEYGGWPESGEIDIMEHVGYNPDSIYGTVHTYAYNHGINTHKAGEIMLKDSETAFHTYTIEWTKDNIKWFIDDKEYFEFKNEGKTFSEWPFDKRFHLILNQAIGGNWGGKHGVDELIYPQKMLVDYVRVYQKSDKTLSAK